MQYYGLHVQSVINETMKKLEKQFPAAQHAQQEVSLLDAPIEETQTVPHSSGPYNLMIRS